MSVFSDRLIDRRTSGDLKHNRHILSAMAGCPLPEEVYPMWIADMDFAAPSHVLDALHRRIDHGIFGYPAMPRAFGQAVAFWQKARFGWEADPEAAVLLPGVLAGLQIAIRALTREGDGVIVQPPVYDRFAATIRAAGRRVVENPLLYQDGRYTMDLEGLSRLLEDSSNRLLILCSPHNPVGRVWSEEELRRVGLLCLAHGVRVVVDEIHADLVYGTRRNIPLLSLSPDFSNQFLVLSSPSKTFNLAGLKTAWAMIPNPELRRIFQAAQSSLGLEGKNTLGLTALQAAYSPESLPWVEELVAYLAGNAALLEDFFRCRKGYRAAPPEGTYLFWIDGTATGLDDRALMAAFARRGVIPGGGSAYGTGGAGHLRMNFACPRSRLEGALRCLSQIGTA